MPRYTENSTRQSVPTPANGTHTNARPCRSPLADPLYLTSTPARVSIEIEYRLGNGCPSLPTAFFTAKPSSLRIVPQYDNRYHNRKDDDNLSTGFARLH